MRAAVASVISTTMRCTHERKPSENTPAGENSRAHVNMNVCFEQTTHTHTAAQYTADAKVQTVKFAYTISFVGSRHAHKVLEGARLKVMEDLNQCTMCER
jgi:hypothetical protein